MFQRFYYISWLAVFLSVFSLPTGVFGQTYEGQDIKQVDLRKFAAHPNIFKIVQDKLGFIWMASDHGLFRIDGVHVRHFTTSDYPDLPSDNIRSILVDFDGKLWIASDNGLVIMDPVDEVIQPYPLNSDNTTQLNLSSNFLYMAEDSTIWVGLSNGIASINPRKGFKTIRSDDGNYTFDRCLEVSRILENDVGDIVVQAVCGYNVIFIYVNNQHDNPVGKTIYEAEVGTAQIFKKEKKIFLATRWGLYQFNSEERKFQLVAGKSPFYVSRPWAIEQIGKSSFLTGDKNGRLNGLIFAEDSIFSEYMGNTAGAGVWDILKDRSDCIWLGTDDGAYYYAHRNPKFRNHLTSNLDSNQNGLKTRAIVEQQDGFIYVCTRNGLYQFHPSAKSMEQVKRWDIAQPYSMIAGSKDFLWIGSDGYGLRKFDNREFKFYHRILATTNKDQLGGFWVGELIRDSDSTLWVGTNNGISYKRKHDHQFHIAADLEGNRLLSDTFIHDIKELRQGQYLLGTNKGLYQITRVRKQPEWYFILSKFHDISYKIREICLTTGPDIWLATEDAGLVHYHPTNNSQQRFTETNGLPSDVLYSILPGPNGEFWIGTFDGLSRFDTTTQLFSNFFITDGLPHNEFNSQSQLIASDGTFYMGTQNGLVSFNPEEFATDSSSLPVMINSLVIHNTKRDTTFVESRYSQLTDRIFIGPHDNLVTISYSIADYTKPDGNRFQYHLEGLYKEWHYLGKQTELVLPHLPAGDYVLRIRGAGSDGRWSTNQAAIPISVRAAFHNSWWFRLLVITALAAIMWMIHRYRLSQLLKLQKMRWRISEDLHDELGSSLTGIGIQTELLTATESSSTRASQLREISSHIQDAVSKLGDIVWSLQSETGTLGKLMDRVEEQTHVMLDPSNIEYNLSMTRDHSGLLLREDVMQNSFLIFKEALTNIVKHSNADNVEIKLQYLNQEMLLAIADNGQNGSPDYLKTGGNGLRNMHRRAEKMSGRLTITNDDGFSVELIVPKAFDG